MKISCFIALVFLFTSFSDSVTTYIALRWFGGIELNPHTDTSSFMAMFGPELLTVVLVFLVCLVAVMVLRRRGFAYAVDHSLEEFTSWLSGWDAIAWFLLYVCLLIGSMRIVVIVSNLVFILSGLSPVGEVSSFMARVLNMPQTWMLGSIYVLCAVFFDKPVKRALFFRITPK